MNITVSGSIGIPVHLKATGANINPPHIDAKNLIAPRLTFTVKSSEFGTHIEMDKNPPNIDPIIQHALIPNVSHIKG